MFMDHAPGFYNIRSKKLTHSAEPVEPALKRPLDHIVILISDNLCIVIFAYPEITTNKTHKSYLF